MSIVATLVLVLLTVSANAAAHSLCGVPPEEIFKSSYETGEIQPAPYVPNPALPPDNTALLLSVTYPGDGITVGTQSIQVRGTYAGPPNTGVSIGGVPALQSGTGFLSRDVALTPGSNTVTVTVTTATGVTQSVQRTVTYAAAQTPDAELKSAFPGDYAPFSVRFVPTLRVGIANPVIERIRIDYETDGTFDVDTTDATTRLTHRYQATGLYLATVELTLNDDNMGTPPVVVTATRRVMAEDLDVTRATFCHAFDRFRANLTAQQYAAALQVFNTEVRPNYQGFINGLGTNGGTVATGIGQIVDGTIGQESAQLLLSRPIAGQPGRFRSFPLQFTRDTDGVWRISAL